jgi:DNA repair protein RadA/Sms
MAKAKTNYVCKSCGAQHSKWAGQCAECGEWNSLEEQAMQAQASAPKASRFGGYAGVDVGEVKKATEIPKLMIERLSTGLSEFDRALGGGLVAGSVVLIGGDPGIGKSTLLTQVMAHLSASQETLYVTGEESLQQVSLRAQRLGLPLDNFNLMSETQVEKIIATGLQRKPQVMVVDSIQTIYTELLSSAPGSVGQVRESAAQLVRFAKQSGTSVLIVGHVTKDGALAGPRVLEHMVDSVLYFEGDTSSRYRMIRAIKNRFGSVNELGVFAMMEEGLKQVTNPSAIFLSRSEEDAPGAMVTVTKEGTRPLLVEVQALVDESRYGAPKRLTLGLEQNRLAMLLAVMHRHGGVPMHDQDVFLNVVGGVRITETASDLPVLLSILSSYRAKPIPKDWIAFGFKQAIVPKANVPKKGVEGLILHPVSQLAHAIELLRNT